MRNPLRNARGRTLVGLTIATLFVPVMLGITACFELKTPIGDPEQGWADPRISGAWLSGEPLPAERDAVVWLFEPWDSRTWLVTLLQFDEADTGESTPGEGPDTPVPGAGTAGDDEAGPAAPDSPGAGEPAVDSTQVTVQDAARLALPPDEVARLLHTLTDADRAEFVSGSVFKGWLTSIGPHRYLVLEPRLEASSETGLEPTTWWVFRIVLQGSVIRLDVVDSERDGLADVTSRGAAEAIIARHASDPEFFEPFLVLQRVPGGALDDIGVLVENADLGPE